MKLKLRLFVFIIGVALAAAPALAVDGVIEINQAAALKGGVTPGDAPGFPVTISQAGSYILTGNLSVPDENTTAIRITPRRVTIDLNGFTISGPVSCNGYPPNCSASGTGHGVHATSFEVTIKNGKIAGMGGDGVLGTLGAYRIEGLDVVSNAGICINVGGPSIVRNNVAWLCGLDGISARTNDVLVLQNVSYVNGGLGIAGFASYASNIITLNNGPGATPQVDANALEIGTNECSEDTICP